MRFRISAHVAAVLASLYISVDAQTDAPTWPQVTNPPNSPAPTPSDAACVLCSSASSALDDINIVGYHCVNATGYHKFPGGSSAPPDFTEAECTANGFLWYSYTCASGKSWLADLGIMSYSMCQGYKVNLESHCCTGPTAQPTKDVMAEDMSISGIDEYGIDQVTCEDDPGGLIGGNPNYVCANVNTGDPTWSCGYYYSSFLGSPKYVYELCPKSCGRCTAGYYSQRVTEDHVPDYYLGRLTCPGPTVCIPTWVGNGHCDDCFGCDQYMVATGIYGDCSTCDYFWSGGHVGHGKFDGGDCGDFTFPAAINTKLFDDCVSAGGFRNASLIASMSYTEKRDTIISELVAGGWGTVEEIQLDTDPRIAAKCSYANYIMCLKTNGWWKPTEMASWSKGDRKFEVATRLHQMTTYTSIQLVQMTDHDLLYQCVIGGVHQKIVGFGWMTDLTLNPLSADQKRNHAINQLYLRGKGAIHQLQALHISQLRFLLNYIDS